MIHNIFSRICLPMVLAALAVVGLNSCSSSDSDISEPVPTEINEFIAKYFPNQTVSEFGKTPSGGYHLKLSSSAGLTFSSTYSWEAINGYGSTLPQMLLFDQLPPALYEYLQGLQALDGVYSVSRTSATYTVDLLDSVVTYSIAAGTVAQS